MPDDVDIDYEYERERATSRRRGGVMATLDAQDREMERRFGPEQPKPAPMTYDEARARFGVEKSPLADVLPSAETPSDAEAYRLRGPAMESAQDFAGRRALARELAATGRIEEPAAAPPVTDDRSTIGAIGQAIMLGARDLGGSLLHLPVTMGAMAAGRNPTTEVPADLGGTIDDALLGRDTETRRQEEARFVEAHPDANKYGRMGVDLAGMVALGPVAGEGLATAIPWLASAGRAAKAAKQIAEWSSLGAAFDPEKPGTGALNGAISGGVMAFAGPILGTLENRLAPILGARGALAVRNAVEGVALTAAPQYSKKYGIGWHDASLEGGATNILTMLVMGQMHGPQGEPAAPRLSDPVRRAMEAAGISPETVARIEPVVIDEFGKAMAEGRRQRELAKIRTGGDRGTGIVEAPPGADPEVYAVAKKAHEAAVKDVPPAPEIAKETAPAGPKAPTVAEAPPAAPAPAAAPVEAAMQPRRSILETGRLADLLRRREAEAQAATTAIEPAKTTKPSVYGGEDVPEWTREQMARMAHINNEPTGAPIEEATWASRPLIPGDEASTLLVHGSPALIPIAETGAYGTVEVVREPGRGYRIARRIFEEGKPWGGPERVWVHHPKTGTPLRFDGFADAKAYAESFAREEAAKDPALTGTALPGGVRPALPSGVEAPPVEPAKAPAETDADIAKLANAGPSSGPGTAADVAKRVNPRFRPVGKTNDGTQVYETTNASTGEVMPYEKSSVSGRLTQSTQTRYAEAKANAMTPPTPPSKPSKRDMGQAGFLGIGGPDVKVAEGAGRDFLDTIQQRGFQRVHRANPQAAQHAWGAASAPQYAENAARGTERGVATALKGSGFTPTQFEQAIQERTYRWTHEQNIRRSTDPDFTPEEQADYAEQAAKGPRTLVGAAGSTFPDESSYQAFWDSPAKDKALNVLRSVLGRQTADYQTASGAKASKMYPVDPVLGVHYSLNPFNEAKVEGSKSKTLHTPEGIAEGGGERVAGGSTSGLLRRPRTSKPRTGGSYAYETSLYENVKNQVSASREAAEKVRAYNELVKSDDASFKPVRELKGDSVVPIDVRKVGGPKGEGTTLYVREPIAPDVKRFTDARFQDLDALARVSGAATAVNLFLNPPEIASHIAGALKGVAAAPSNTGLPPFVEAGIKAVAGPAWDAFKVKRAISAIADTPQAELDRLAEQVPGVLRFMPKELNFHNATSHGIERVWNGLAVYFNRVYDAAVKKGAVDTPEARRRFILRYLGNYNFASHPEWLRNVRKYVNPFAVPGIARAVGGAKALTGSTGIETTGAKAWLGQRAIGAANIAAPIIWSTASWMILTGHPPPKDVPYGGMPIPGLPEKDEKGRTRYIDLMDLTTLRRGQKAVGLDAYEQARRGGLDLTKAAGSAAYQAITRGAGTLTSGPAIDFGKVAVTGKNEIGQQVAPLTYGDFSKTHDIRAFALNALYALGESNTPAGLVMHAAGASREGGDSLKDKLLSTVGVKKGPGEAYMERLPDIRDKQDFRSWMDDARMRLFRAKGTSDFGKVKAQIQEEAKGLRDRIMSERKARK